MKHFKKLYILTILLLLVGYGNAQDSAEYTAFLEKAGKNFGSRAEKLNETYKLGDFERWDYLQEDGKLRFSNGGKVRVIAEAQIVGSFSIFNGTWMWSWANESVDKAVKRDIEKVKDFGEKNRFPKLTKKLFECEEEDAWTLTKAAGEVLNAKGTYRGQIQDGWVYFLITDIEQVVE